MYRCDELWAGRAHAQLRGDQGERAGGGQRGRVMVLGGWRPGQHGGSRQSRSKRLLTQHPSLLTLQPSDSSLPPSLFALQPPSPEHVPSPSPASLTCTADCELPGAPDASAGGCSCINTSTCTACPASVTPCSAAWCAPDAGRCCSSTGLRGWRNRALRASTWPSVPGHAQTPV